jgi:glycine dehydrogenase subunit 1
MLAEIGAPDIEALFDEIPDRLSTGALKHVPEGMSELAMLQLMDSRARQDEGYTCFLGAGSYDHHIPSAVWDLTARGEFMTAYTPYQAEASQGTLQLIYEYQSMMTALTGMDVSNASVYDGASGLAEAMLMALRANKKNKSGEIWVAGTLHPHYREAAANIVRNQGVSLSDLPVHKGLISSASTKEGAPAAVVIQQPNFFGALEEVDALVDWAHDLGALVIAVVNPMSLAVLKAPGNWGSGDGADIVCGDGQVFGVPMASGGPSFGFMCCRNKFVRQMPGRIIGKTVDLEGRDGYALTLQAREQHIRRGKATSNICTNQGLLVTAGTIYMALMGAQGLRETALQSHAKAVTLRDRLLSLPGVSAPFDAPIFNEFTLKLDVEAAEVIAAMRAQKILAGLDLGDFVSMDNAGNHLLVAVTEKRTQADLDQYVTVMKSALGVRE